MNDHVELTPEAKAHQEKEIRKAINTRKINAIETKETIVFAIDIDQYGNYIVATLENPYMLMAAGTKEKAIRNAFEVFLKQTFKDNSGDTEVSQPTTSNS